MAVNAETLRPHRQWYPQEPLLLDFHSAKLTDQQFDELCRNNRDLKFELSGRGQLIVVPPTSPESGYRNTELTLQVATWAKRDGTGVVFDSSTMFTFPNGAKRSPDVSWMPRDKWDALSDREKRRFSRAVPDFVIELLSPSDDLIDTQEKMAEYIENGVRLGWLIDPESRTVYVYRANGEVEEMSDPPFVSGENVLDGFELNVREVW